MSKKQHLINKIKGFEEKYFNEDQKLIATNILENAPEKQVQAYFDFISMKRRTGFAFDYSPEIAKGRLITLREDKGRRINVSDEVEENENKLIIGDNYNALKSLLVTHKDRIDIIYIDPPYNTEAAKKDGNQSSKNGTSSKFIYKDKFGRGGWLNMMKARLCLAKELLTSDGIIFVSIDDSEQAYLKVLMDQIFGEQNFISSMPRRTKSSGALPSGFLKQEHEYTLVYKKYNIENFSGKKSNLLFYNKEDKKGKYISRPLDVPGLTYSKNMDYPLEINGKMLYPGGKKEYLKRESGSISKKDWTWRWSKDLMINAFNKNYLYIDNGRLYQKLYFNFNLNKKTLKLEKINRENSYSSIEMIDAKYSNYLGTKMLAEIDIKEFDHPKPVCAIKFLISLIKNKNALILDFFAGAGSTGQAVMELNRNDNGDRKFILVTNNENQIAHNITYERLHRIIKGETTSGKKDFNWIKENNPYLNEKLRVINIDDSIKISLDKNVPNKVYEDCQNGLKLLSKKYQKSGISLYYDLAALNPLEYDENKFNS